MRQFFNQFNKDFKQTLVNPVFFMMTGLCCSIWGFVFPRKLFEFARVAGVNPFAQGGMRGGATIFMKQFLSVTCP